MSDIDMDEDLLALAGADEETEEESDLPIKRSKSSTTRSRKRSKRDSYSDESEEEDDDEDDEEEEDGQEEDDDEETEEEPLIKNPYPLEGKYINEKDRVELESMNEIEREEILYERAKQMEEYRQNEIINQRIRERKREKKTRKPRAAKSESSSGKGSQLKELKKRRQEKESRNKRRSQGVDSEFQPGRGDSDSEDGYGDEEGYEDEDEQVQWAEPEKTEPVTERALNKIRWGRTLLSKFCHHPGFESAVIGCFVRINTGKGYKVAAVKELVPSKTYQLLSTKIDQNLRVAIGTKAMAVEMSILSDSPFSQQEFLDWKSTMDRENLSIPSMKKIDRKFKELQQLQTYQLTNQEIDDMIKKKQQIAGKVGVDSVVEKSTLMEARVIAMSKGEYMKVQEIDQRLQEIDRNLAKARRQQEKDKLAQVNERNRQANVNEIRRAEIVANEQRRKAEASGRSADPFSRLRTSARIFYNSDQSVSNGGDKKEVEQEQEKSEPTISRRKGVVHVDDVIGALNINLDFAI